MDFTIVNPAVPRVPARRPAEPPYADEQVVVGHIPAPRPGFQPRPRLLTRLNQAGPGPVATVLVGPAGVGKTELAATYARGKMAGGWRLIGWVDAQNGQVLLAGLAVLADAVRPSADGAPHAEADPGLVVRRWLEADGNRCLLVFDGARDLSLLRPFMPTAGAAQILITSAGEPRGELGLRIPVDVFSEDEAQAVLAGRTALADETGASAMAAVLGRLPLALDLAATVIAREHSDYAGYLTRLSAGPAGSDQARAAAATEQPYPLGVAGAVRLSLAAADAGDRLGVCAGVIEVLAILSPAAVPRDLLHTAGQAGTLLGRGRRVAPSMVDRALAQLTEQSLLRLSLDGQLVSVHGLIAEVVRAELAGRRGLAATYVAAASSLVQYVDAQISQPGQLARAELLGQVMALADNARELVAEADEEVVRALLQPQSLVLHHLSELGVSPAAAITIGEPLTAELERRLGPSHPDTVRAENDLALAYREAGRLAEAIPLLERALAAEEEQLGADHLGTLVSRNNLGSAYRASGRATEAIAVFAKNVAVCDQLLGADHPKTLASRHSLELARQEAQHDPAG